MRYPRGSCHHPFPRLNAFSYWLYLFGGLTVVAGFLTPGGAADFGWFAYTPLSSAISSPGVGADLWITGLLVSGLGTILGAVNMVTTIACARLPPQHPAHTRATTRLPRDPLPRRPAPRVVAASRGTTGRPAR